MNDPLLSTAHSAVIDGVEMREPEVMPDPFLITGTREGTPERERLKRSLDTIAINIPGTAEEIEQLRNGTRQQRESVEYVDKTNLSTPYLNLDAAIASYDLDAYYKTESKRLQTRFNELLPAPQGPGTEAAADMTNAFKQISTEFFNGIRRSEQEHYRGFLSKSGGNEVPALAQEMADRYARRIENCARFTHEWATSIIGDEGRSSTVTAQFMAGYAAEELSPGVAEALSVSSPANLSQALKLLENPAFRQKLLEETTARVNKAVGEAKQGGNDILAEKLAEQSMICPNVDVASLAPLTASQRSAAEEMTALYKNRYGITLDIRTGGPQSPFHEKPQVNAVGITTNDPTAAAFASLPPGTPKRDVLNGILKTRAPECILNMPQAPELGVIAFPINKTYTELGTAGAKESFQNIFNHEMDHFTIGMAHPSALMRGKEGEFFKRGFGSVADYTSFTVAEPGAFKYAARKWIDPRYSLWPMDELVMRQMAKNPPPLGTGETVYDLNQLLAGITPQEYLQQIGKPPGANSETNINVPPAIGIIDSDPKKKNTLRLPVSERVGEAVTTIDTRDSREVGGGGGVGSLWQGLSYKGKPLYQPFVMAEGNISTIIAPKDKSQTPARNLVVLDTDSDQEFIAQGGANLVRLSAPAKDVKLHKRLSNDGGKVVVEIPQDVWESKGVKTQKKGTFAFGDLDIALGGAPVTFRLTNRLGDVKEVNVSLEQWQQGSLAVTGACDQLQHASHEKIEAMRTALEDDQFPPEPISRYRPPSSRAR